MFDLRLRFMKLIGYLIHRLVTVWNYIWKITQIELFELFIDFDVVSSFMIEIDEVDVG